ncbi:MAG: hypothetical protein JKX97_04425 [Candidatus Lindowbacteria bacterium]|nr:hypothetical protein [Candidatus Lindowbacteria bacterium]
MNIAIVDGTISSTVMQAEDSRRTRIRFLVKTNASEEIAIEVRGDSASMILKTWGVGDIIHIRGRLSASGYIAADTIRRLQKATSVSKKISKRGPSPHRVKNNRISSRDNLQMSWAFFPTGPVHSNTAMLAPIPAVSAVS